METKPTGSDAVRNKMKEHSNQMHHKIDAESLRQMLREVKKQVFPVHPTDYSSNVSFSHLITEMSSSYERSPSNKIW